MIEFNGATIRVSSGYSLKRNMDPGSYDMHERSVFFAVEVPLPDGTDEKALRDTLSDLDVALGVEAQLQVFAALGVEYEEVDGTLVPKATIPQKKGGGSSGGRSRRGSFTGNRQTQGRRDGRDLPKVQLEGYEGLYFDQRQLKVEQGKPQWPDFAPVSGERGGGVWVTGKDGTINVYDEDIIPV